MNLITPLGYTLTPRLLLAAVLFGAFAIETSGQQVAPPSPASTDQHAGPAETNIPSTPVVLSPFQINTTKDEGFVATSALAGGRLAIDLKDNPAAYSVLTSEFINATQIQDVQQSTRWSVNTNLVMDNGQNELSFGGVVQVTIRGVTNLFVQRNFFPSKLIDDTYNADRLDFGRGPNAVLYGFSSFGGTQNVVTKEAKLEQNFSEVRLTDGSWSDLRGTVDINRVLNANKTVALRVNLLDQNTKGWHDHEWDRKKAMDLAGKWELTKTTELRVDYEKGRFETARAFAFPADQILGWDGVTTFNSLQQNTGAIANNAAKGVAVYGNLANNTSAFIYAPALSTSTVLDLAGTVHTTATQGLTASTRTIGGIPYVGNNNFSALPLFGSEGVSYPSIYSAAEAGSHFVDPSRTFGTAVIDNKPTASVSYYTSSIFLTQHLGNLFAELAANQTLQSRDSFIWSRGLNNAYIDLNANKIDGTPNPEFLQPYSEGPLNRQVDMYDEENLRAAVAYILDAQKLGKYTLNAMTGFYHERRDDLIYGYFAQRASDPSLWTGDPVLYRFYWNQPSREIDYPNQVTYIDANGNKQVAKAGWMRLIAPNSFNSNQGFRDIRGSVYQQIAARGSFLDDKLNLLASYRADNYFHSNFTPQHNYSYYGINWDGTTTLWRPEAPSQSFYQALAYFPKDSNGNITGALTPAISRPRNAATGAPLAQYAGDKFQDDYSGFTNYAKPHSTFGGAVYRFLPWVSLAVNYSQGLDFNDASNTRYNGQTFGPKTSKGEDVSLRFNLLNDRVYAVITAYKGTQTGIAISDGGAFGNVNTILGTPIVGNLTPNATNGRGIALLPGTGWDVQDQSNSGLEFETITNLSRSWRLTFNVALPKATQNNSNSDFRTYFDANQASLKNVLTDAGIIFDANNVASLDPNVSAALRPPNGQDTNAVNAWNALVTQRKNVVAGDQELLYLNKLTANIFTDYTFREGILKNVRVGGGINYRGKQVIGYRGADTIADVTSAKTAQGYYTGTIDNPNVGPYDVVYQPAYYIVTGTIGYKHTIYNVPIEWTLSLDNLFNYSKPIYYNVGLRPINGDLTNPGNNTVPAVFNYVAPINYSLAISAKF
jgi:outer membrane receptor protein involved in Fe transport